MDPNEIRYAVVGHPIGHTMSPFIHMRLFALNHRRERYGVLDVPPEELEQSMDRLSRLCGCNITIPHKQAIIPYLDAVEEKAACFGSVNTVKSENGVLTGYTTDGTGFRRALQAAGEKPEGRVVILGAGGAARAMAFEAALCGARITVAARPHSLPAAQQLCKDLMGKIPGTAAGFCALDEITDGIDLLANATPVGMYPRSEECPVSEEVVRSAGCVFDAVYNPNETLLLRLARKNGVKAVSGMSMLVWQAAAAQEIWYGAEFTESDIARLCGDAVLEMKKKFGNVILCGFMGCGKTTVGKIVAEKTGRAFVDMDRVIERNEGMTVAEIFAKSGEQRFRELEREAAAALGREHGLVIAAGGGTLLNRENAASLKGNGVVILLDASLSAIRTRLADDTSRPLLARPDRDAAMQRLFAERIKAYRDAADTAVPADGAPETVAEQVFSFIRPAVLP
ncbi:MAG: shikimate dehydrogenase [Clostridiales bacterium]|jgi:shikimate dehydrogenase|nr:shikimate dehydrogenase [Clostridiales bacterium]